MSHGSAPSRRFTIFSAKVLSETIEQETLVISLETGSYYSLRGSASVIWEMLRLHHSLDEIADLCAGVAGFAKEDLERFADQLCAERLLRPSADAAATASSPVSLRRPEGKYTRPELTKYTDMEALLLADPIHEVAL